MKASAISAITSDRDSRRVRRPADARTPSVSTAFGSVRVACHSGARLESALARPAVPSVNASTRQSTATSSTRGMYSAAIVTTARTSAMLATTPTAAPTSETMRPSTKYWIARRRRPTPSATRMAVSCARATARARRSAATLAHVISSSTAAAPRSSSSVGLMLLADQPAQRIDHRGVRLMVARILSRDLGGDVLHLGVGLRERDAGLQPHVREQESILRLLTFPVRVESDPHVAAHVLAAGRHFGQPEAIGHDAGQREGPAVQDDGAADEARVLAEAHPQARAR